MRSVLTPILFLILQFGYSQYAIGVRSGPMIFGPFKDDIISNISVTTFGVILQHSPQNENGFRFGLDFIERRFDLDQLNLLNDVHEDLTMKVRSIQLTSEIRFLIGDSSSWYFDFGPLIGATFMQEWSGTGTYDVGPSYPAIIYNDERKIGLKISDVRLRFGLSKDIPVLERSFITLGAAVSPGWAAWYRTRQYFTVDAQLFLSVQYLIRKPIRAPEQIADPIGYFPRNSRLTELMQKRFPVGGGPSSKM